MGDTDKWADAVRRYYGITITDAQFTSVRQQVKDMIESDYSLQEILAFVDKTIDWRKTLN